MKNSSILKMDERYKDTFFDQKRCMECKKIEDAQPHFD